MGKLWFTSDLHFGHHNPVKQQGILYYCAGRTAIWGHDIDAMNAGLLERINATVAPGDMLIILGDAAMGKREDSLKFCKAINCYDIIVPGNHDNCWEKGRDGSGTTEAKFAKNRADYFKWGGFDEIWQPPMVLGEALYGVPEPLKRVILTHLPPAECGDHTDDVRYAAHRPAYPPEDTWMLCGHVHEAWKVHGRVINVGVDVWDYKPVSVEQILAVMEG
jgi:calcineurin-like phosphoesterase family protein